MRNDFETLSLEKIDAHILLVTLDRPEASNALNTRMGLDLMALFEGLLLDLEDLRVIVLTGRGEKAFCAGGDLKERLPNGNRSMWFSSECCGPSWAALSR
jgi:enoyl-CoA hydratase